ncbi:flagellar biosynthesis protein FlhF [Parapusillimonas granuli]|uniref:Flagellar biosynthesis protein FlhF n=1 Tax=Parapusillimonas granuli TaxID=380911 RepID=A0A853FX34_9BURK|nr:flagellar biosynthesis protein FlhF [Parapusillimonas granuli]MEB2398503.1 flagellar biosynthesis protein FlhF [Alcaligenaceae bacterium]NYT48242.1 flagellar biosynthesis protein FlhF [Parapusillimonas granuli]
MNISRFFGSTNREALRQVRLALGPDALIVSNRRVNGGVEILATDPTSAAAAQQTQAQAQAGAGFAEPSVSLPADASAPVDLMSAIGDMRGALESRIDELLWGNQLRRAPQAVALFQALLGFGFSTALLRAMLKRLPEQLSGKAAFQWARNELVRHLPVLRSEDDLWKPGLALALVGPTGVGKTTTIAKLAARCVRRSGPGSLVLITTDTYRIGAHEQLKIYGQMLRVPVHVVQNVNELRQVMQAVAPDQTMLIDNVGISQRDRYIAEQAAMLAGAGRPVTRLLVLNAPSHGDTLDEVARNYANDGGTPLKGCIITKADEASRLGAALDTALRYKLPIHYVSTGQKVPEDLHFLHAAELVDQALVHSRHVKALYAPTEADLAALMSLSKPSADQAEAATAEARRKHLLPRLLSMAGEMGSELSMDDMQSACAYIDDCAAVSEAYDLWRGHTSGHPDPAPLDSYVRHMARVAQNEMSEGGIPLLLALHDQISLPPFDGERAQLRATLFFGDKGQALATPMQQLASGQGWLSSTGDSAQSAPSSADALLHQVEWLATEHAGLPVLHVFDGGNQPLWRRVDSLGAPWLAACAPTTRVEVDATGTTVGAVAKTLRHTLIVDDAKLPRLAEIAGVPGGNVALWAAAETVQLAARQNPDLSAQLVSLRIVDRTTGAVIKSLLGLGNAPAAGEFETLARALLLKSEGKQAMRFGARIWQVLPRRGGAQAEQKKALVAMQSGLAAWQLKQSPDAALARNVGGGLIAKPGLPGLSAPQALYKLFALKELWGQAAGA